MNPTNVKNQPQTQTSAPQPSGLRVRSDLRAGAWNCTNCEGTVNGNRLSRPTCEFCQRA